MKGSLIVTIAGFAMVVVVGVLAIMASSSAHRITVPEDAQAPVGSEWARTESMGCNQGPTNPPSSAIHDLDEDAMDWGVYCEGSPMWVKESATMPSIDGKSLRCSIVGGDPYSNMHCYRNLLSEPATAMFTLTLSFWFSPTITFNNRGAPSTIQALEFTMNKWKHSKRYEFALQWQNVGEGAPQWRYWDPEQSESWVSLGVTKTEALELEEGLWHSFALEGGIINGQVHYKEFTIDQQSYDLDVTVFPASVPEEPDRLAVAVQLDDNFEEMPYDVFFDQVSFIRKPATQVTYLGL